MIALTGDPQIGFGSVTRIKRKQAVTRRIGGGARFFRRLTRTDATISRSYSILPDGSQPSAVWFVYSRIIGDSRCPFLSVARKPDEQTNRCRPITASSRCDGSGIDTGCVRRRQFIGHRCELYHRWHDQRTGCQQRRAGGRVGDFHAGDRTDCHGGCGHSLVDVSDRRGGRFKLCHRRGDSAHRRGMRGDRRRQRYAERQYHQRPRSPAPPTRPGPGRQVPMPSIPRACTACRHPADGR